MTGLEKKNLGFSLTEVLLAVGILSVGMTFIAGVFPVAIYLTTVATERTVAAVAADEAFAKVRIYAEGDLYDPNDDIDLSRLYSDELTEFTDVNAFPATEDIEPNEFEYPSAGDMAQKQYFWSALCRRAGPQLVQVTVFISRKVSQSSQYPDPNGSGTVDRPMPVKVGVEDAGPDNELRICSRPDTDVYDDKTFINDGYTIVDNESGRIYRVLERYKAPDDNIILLDRNWDDSSPGSWPDIVWVVPPPVTGGRGPCIAVYQKTTILLK